MGLSTLKSILATFRHDSIGRGLTETNAFIHSLLRKWNTSGTNILDHEWDICVILDACRPDVINDCRDGYSWIPDPVPSQWSVGSYSKQWMKRTFQDRHTSSLAYVTGNPFSDLVLDSSDFGRLDEVWRYAWDDDLGTQPPRPLTDRAIAAVRDPDIKRVVAHYMQPHFPTLHGELTGSLDPDNFEESPDFTDPFDLLQSGDLAHERVWKAYRENCEIVLEDVQMLLESINCDSVLITADHANSFGELGIYGHPMEFATDSIRRIPWIRTSASNVTDYEPSTLPKGYTESGIEDHLEALGYR